MPVEFIANTITQTLGKLGALVVKFAIDSDTTAGNTIVLCASTNQSIAGVGVTVSDSKGNAWVVDNGPKQANGLHVVMASTRQDKGPLLSGGVDHVTLTYSHGIGTAILVDAREFSPLGTVDVKGSNYSASTIGPIDSGGAVPIVGGDLFVSTFCTGDESIGVTPNAAGTVGFYDFCDSIYTFNGATQTLTTGHQVVPGAGVLQRHCMTMAKHTSMAGLITAYKSATPLAGANDLILE